MVGIKKYLLLRPLIEQTTISDWSSKNNFLKKVLVETKKYLLLQPLIRIQTISINSSKNKLYKKSKKSFCRNKKVIIFAIPFTSGNKKKQTVLKKYWKTGRSVITSNKKEFIQRRVWSWLRMNASGRPNTCKSSEIILDLFEIWKRRTGA